jgi:hypothetical protein
VLSAVNGEGHGLLRCRAHQHVTPVEISVLKLQLLHTQQQLRGE